MKPFNLETQIPILVSRESDAILKVYDISGILVNTLYNGLLTAGFQTIPWEGQNASGDHVSSRVYFYEVEVNGKRTTRNMLLIR